MTFSFDRAHCPVCNPMPIRTRTARLSVSVPASLAQWARARAAERGVTVSRIVEEALTHDAHIRQGCAA